MNWKDRISAAAGNTQVQWTIVPAAAAFGLTFLPGFDVLSFYFCLPMALLLAMAAGSVSISAVSQAVATGKTTTAGALAGLRWSVALTLPPLLVITLSHFINGPCDYLYGIVHYLVGPVMSAVTGSITGSACAVAARREKWASAIFIAIFAGSFVPAGFMLYFDPAVNFFNPFLGYYPGPIYDELIEVTPAYLFFRLWCLAASGALWSTVRLFRDAHGRPAFTTRRAPYVLSATLIALTVAGTAAPGNPGFRTTRKDVMAELSFVVSDSFCRIHADQSFAKQPDLPEMLLKDCGYRYRRAAAFFGVVPDRPVDVFVYRDAEQKARLMGARYVEISKPWLNEIHVTDVRPGDMVLAHEIAHVAAGRRSGNILAMPLTWGIFPNMGLVEGLAVAAAFADDGPSPHEWALAMIRAGIDPDLESLFAPLSFITGGAAASYATAGSFIRFIYESHGTAAIGILAGGGSFAEAAGQPFDKLKSRWLRFLESEKGSKVDNVLQMRAASRFSDPGVLHRKCPLDVSRRLRDAMDAYESKDLDLALEKVREAASFDGRDRDLMRIAARLEFTSARGIGDASRFDRIIEDVIRPPEGAASMADRTAAADLLIIRGLNDVDESRASSYRERAGVELRSLLAMLAPGSAMRGICARMMALESSRTAALAIVEALSDPRPFNEGDTDRLLVASAVSPENALLHYLAGKAAMRDGLYAIAMESFLAALGSGFREPGGQIGRGRCTADFTAESWKFLGISAFWAKDPATATEAVRSARRQAGFEGDRLIMDEYLERIAEETRPGGQVPSGGLRLRETAPTTP